MLDEIDGFLKSSGDMQTALRKYRRLTSVKAECYKALFISSNIFPLANNLFLLRSVIWCTISSSLLVLLLSGELAEIHNDKSTK